MPAYKSLHPYERGNSDLLLSVNIVRVGHSLLALLHCVRKKVTP